MWCPGPIETVNVGSDRSRVPAFFFGEVVEVRGTVIDLPERRRRTGHVKQCVSEGSFSVPGMSNQGDVSRSVDGLGIGHGQVLLCELS